MESNSEIIIPIGAQKHDPAWKHCLMISSDGRTMLKCMYCHKKFLGGGIHRIKEHLARQKGNASCCSKVPVEVQHSMQQSLDSVTIRKEKKQKLTEEIDKLNTHHMTLDEVQGLQLHTMFDQELIQMEARDEPLSKSNGRGRKKKPRQSSPYSQLRVQSCVGPNKSLLAKDEAYMAICRCLYESGAPLDMVNSIYFQPMIDAIAASGGIPKPSYSDVSSHYLKRNIEEVNGSFDHYKMTWSRTGCSLLADEWITETGRTLMNFFVYCPEGTVFLKSVDASHVAASSDTLYELLKSAVEEVGMKNIIQVITNNTNNHIFAGEKLTKTYPSLFWTPCTSICVDGILEDISKMDTIAEVIETAKSVTSFIYSHAVVLNMMRKYTNGRDLLHHCQTKSCMNFLALKCMVMLKDELRAMVSSEEWIKCPYSKKPGGIVVSINVNNLVFWSSCAAIVRTIEPLMQVMKLVDSQKMPAMGYIYASMHQAKETLKKELVKKLDYMPYCDIIEWRWEKNLSPLHAAGFFFNPRFFYSIQGAVSNRISSAVLDCIERLVPETKVQDKIQKELTLYKSAAGDFGRKMAVRARHTLLPAEWWSTYGGACPNLTRLAIRILSQTCSARISEQNHIPFEQIHNHRMNSMEHQRLSDLLYVRCNMRLQQRNYLKNRPFDPISVDNIDIVDNWTVEKSEMFLADEDSSWMMLDQSASQNIFNDDNDVETFIIGFDDEMIRRAGQEVEDDDEDIKDNEDDHEVASFS